jgi:hypothetical protein
LRTSRKRVSLRRRASREVCEMDCTVRYHPVWEYCILFVRIHARVNATMVHFRPIRSLCTRLLT